jgi:hypothetical protein
MLSGAVWGRATDGIAKHTSGCTAGGGCRLNHAREVPAGEPLEPFRLRRLRNQCEMALSFGPQRDQRCETCLFMFTLRRACLSHSRNLSASVPSVECFTVDISKRN